MYSFKDDYSEGAHPNILARLLETNMEQETGYGLDSHTRLAINKIKAITNNSDIDVHLICGGTQTNLTAISAFLRPHEACIAANTGHIATHETGAIEYSGHKVITVDSSNGKISPRQVQKVLKLHTNEHSVKPKLVYISNSTEVGTIYLKEELIALSDFCKKNNLILYLDGARLGSALCSNKSNMSLSDISYLTDAFSIGGTKNGALLGEALVISTLSLKEDFRYYIKQRGALLAKGRVLGIQFEELFTDNLYFDLAKHANDMSALLSDGLRKAGCKFLFDSYSNQIFPILNNKTIELLQKQFSFIIWQSIDEDNSAIRLVTSWATKEEAVVEFIKAITR